MSTVVKNRPDLPQAVSAIPMVRLKQHEPPTACNIDTSDFNIDQRDVTDTAELSTLSPDAASWWGSRLAVYMSKWSLLTTPPRSRSTTATTPSTGVRSPDSEEGGVLATLESWSNLGSYFRRSPGD